MASSSIGEREDSSAAVTQTEEEDGEERRSWLELPREVMASILSRLFAVDVLCSAQFACKAWFEISKDPLVWRRIDMYDIGDPRFEMGLALAWDLRKMCRCAIDRSCGQAVSVHIQNFGNDDILNYITDRSTQIKQLRLTRCYGISEAELIEAVAKLPLLEELELTFTPVAVETLEAVGRHCPRLKSFKFNSEAIICIEDDDFNGDALAIGKNMPELTHLQLIGNSLTNKGLEAILDGCPKLELLDIRRCINISTNGGIWKKCTDQVKHLRRPNDSTEDCPLLTPPDDESSDIYVCFGSDYGYDYHSDDFSYPYDLDYEGGDYLIDTWSSHSYSGHDPLENDFDGLDIF